MQSFNSNDDSSAGAGVLQNIWEVSRKNGVSYRRRQLVEENVKIGQSNHSNSHGESSSAFWRLPTEILAQIFLHCITETEHWTPAPYLAPMLLTTVCQRWREVAVDMPGLWRRLRLEVGEGDWQQRAFCYDSYLKRSRGQQLSLALEYHNNDWTELRSLLQPYVDQITSLTLEFFSGAGALVVMSDFRALEELAIDTHSGLYRHSGSELAVTQSIAQLPPNLRSLQLMDMWFDREILSGFNPLAWAGLTELDIVVDGLDSFPRLLRLCPNLSSLTMVGIFTEIETSETLVHDKLQSLRISGDLPLDSGLFNAIMLPNLRALEVRNLGQWPHEDFKDFLTRSKCSLETLIFGGGVMVTFQQSVEYATLFPFIDLTADPMRSSFFF
ncbi:hypothetical protein EV702DRAFT_1200380 [Suillus placidus]|uniref:F-box domain-containing protein n=1 Tax=Suillus placidus TaxID=48579 RepID=A0A9P6ZPY7_9AGAM|nr:hypothetical protein EV702DRAFT_1200380 [Suillus placidus]